ncbi:flagellar protein FlaG [Lysobacter xanthus]
MPDVVSIAPAAVPAAPAARPVARAPATSPPATPPRVPPTPEALQRQLDDALADADTSLRFRVDRQSGRIVVAVVDHNGEVVLQVPDEAALAVARHLARSGSLLDLKA